MQRFLGTVLQADAFLSRGPRVALKRWFSLAGASIWHDGVWHSRFLAMLAIGIEIGAYRSHRDVLLRGGPL
eukprot:11208599-Lingulodinium_polyedra.AAC.1